MTPLTITEQQFTNSVLDWAKTYGWRCFHVRTSGRMSNGKPIPTVQGDKGFPDLVLIRKQRMIIAELKVGTNKPTAEQSAWMAAFQSLNCGVEIYTWYPRHWSEILVILSRPSTYALPVAAAR